MIIGIVGLIASGKSTIGSIIAKKEGMVLFDMDYEFPEEYRERHRKGEVVPPEDVKDYQCEMIERLLKKSLSEDIVMAGFFLDKDLPNYIEKNADIVWINLFTENRKMLEERIKKRENHFVAGMEVLDDNWETRKNQIIGNILVNCENNIETVVEECITHIKKRRTS